MIDMTFFPTWAHFWLTGSIIFFSQFLYACLGFGAGMFAISLLTLVLGRIHLLVPFFLIICLPTECAIFFAERRYIHASLFSRLLLLLFPAVCLGAFLLRQPANSLLAVFLGLIIMLLSLFYLFFEQKMRLSLKHPCWPYLFGSLAGFLGGLFGMAGPPLIFYFKGIGMGKRAFRVALISLFLMLTLFKIAAYSFFALFTPIVLVSALVILPFGLAGLAAGAWFHHRLPEQNFKRVTSGVLFFCGLTGLVKKHLLGQQEE